MELAERKQQLRQEMAARRDRIDGVRASEAGAHLTDLLSELEEYLQARRIALYAALPDEIPTASLARAARTVGKDLLWPRIREGRLEFAACRPEDLAPGRFGILSPPDGAPALLLGPDDLVVVPGVAFDAQGRRLGRGGGYYDRSFADDSSGPRLIGVAYDFQVVEEVPTGPRDRTVDRVVSERRVVR